MAPHSPVYEEVKANSRRWKENFNQPLPLGVKKKLTVLTCMDSRLIPERMLGLDVGDAEIIRNGGGRVTADVLRSLVITQDLLGCNTILVIHHNDCGGQAVVRHHTEVMLAINEDMKKRAPLPIKLAWKAGWYASYLVPGFLRRIAVNVVVRPVYDLHDSVLADMKWLRRAPNVKHEVNIYGLLYNVNTGDLVEIARDEGGGLLVTDEYKRAKRAQQDGSGKLK